MILEEVKFVNITKTLCIQLEKARQRPQTYYKKNCFWELFCNDFGQNGTKTKLRKFRTGSVQTGSEWNPPFSTKLQLFARVLGE